MDPAEYASLAKRLIDNAQDTDALAGARRIGMRDPGAYALLLEKVAHGTEDRRIASHWFVEAAAVWSTTLGDLRRAESVVRDALRADPWNDRAAERLVQILEANGDQEAALAALEGRVAACSTRMSEGDDGPTRIVTMYLDLGRRWNSLPVPRPERALPAFERAMALDPRNVDAIRGGRTSYLALGRWNDVIATFEKERNILRKRSDHVRLLRDEAGVRRMAGDMAGMVQALRLAHSLDENDLDTTEELANSILARVTAGESISREERAEAAALFVMLAETYDGEIALANALNAMRANPGDDTAMNLSSSLAASLRHESMMQPYWVAYLGVNPKGKHATQVRLALAKAYEESGRPEDAIKVLAPIERENDQAASKVMALVQKTGRIDDLVARLDAQAVSLPPVARFDVLLEAARLLVQHDRAEAAVARYSQVLALNPAHPEALERVTAHLRDSGKHAQLRDVLMMASGHASTKPDAKRAMLREAAELNEKLGMLEEARELLTQLYEANRNDESIRTPLKRVLTQLAKWEELVRILDREIGAARSAEAVAAVLRQLAEVHEHKRSDLLQAGNSWARIAKLVPDDADALMNAVGLYERANRVDLAASLLSGAIDRIKTNEMRAVACGRLVGLWSKQGNHAEAAEAACAQAAITDNPDHWRAAESHYASAELWTKAVTALDRQASADNAPAVAAALYGRKAEYLARSGNKLGAVAALERACELAPNPDPFVADLEKRCEEAGELARFVSFALRRGDASEEKQDRAAWRRRAAKVLQGPLHDSAAGLEALRKVIEDVDDPDALAKVADEAERTGEFLNACKLLERLEGGMQEPWDKLNVLLRLARIRYGKLSDADGALATLDRALRDVDPGNREAVDESVRIRAERGDWTGVASVLEGARKHAASPQHEKDIVLRLADVWEHRLADPRKAIEYLRAAREIEPDNANVLADLSRLFGQISEWESLAEVLTARLSKESEPARVANLSLELASVLEEKLKRPQDALDRLSGLADGGDRACRDAFVAIADRAGHQEQAAARLERWAGPTEGAPLDPAGLNAAFDRFVESRRLQDAARTLGKMAGAEMPVAQASRRLEDVALAAHDFEVARTAQGLQIAVLSGIARAEEAVRQAEALVAAGGTRGQAIVAAETELSGLPEDVTEKLLARLGELAATAEDRVSVYERQVARSATRIQRVGALAQAAAVAARHGLMPRCKRLLALGVHTSVHDEDLHPLEQAASQADQALGGSAVRRAWAEALADQATTARGGEARRANLFRRAAMVAIRDLQDSAQAFDWFNEALYVRLESMIESQLRQQSDEIRGLKESLASVSRQLESAQKAAVVAIPAPPQPSPPAPPPVPPPAAESKAAADAPIPVLVDLAPEDEQDKASQEAAEVTVSLQEGPVLEPLAKEPALSGAEPAVPSPAQQDRLLAGTDEFPITLDPGEFRIPGSDRDEQEKPAEESKASG